MVNESRVVYTDFILVWPTKFFRELGNSQKFTKKSCTWPGHRKFLNNFIGDHIFPGSFEGLNSFGFKFKLFYWLWHYLLFYFDILYSSSKNTLSAQNSHEITWTVQKYHNKFINVSKEFIRVWNLLKINLVTQKVSRFQDNS